MFPTKEMGGGSGLKYAASSIIYLSKKKDKDVLRWWVTSFTVRTTSHPDCENKMVDVRLSYNDGLDRYYGLLDLQRNMESSRRCLLVSNC